MYMFAIPASLVVEACCMTRELQTAEQDNDSEHAGLIHGIDVDLKQQLSSQTLGKKWVSDTKDTYLLQGTRVSGGGCSRDSGLVTPRRKGPY